MPEFRLHHIHHEAADVDAATRFYVENFAGVVTERTEKQGYQSARVQVAGTTINVTDRARADVALDRYKGLDHIGIHTNDFDATIAALRANGVNFFIEPMSPAPGVDVAFVSGPDNIKVEVVCISAQR